MLYDCTIYLDKANLPKPTLHLSRHRESSMKYKYSTKSMTYIIKVTHQLLTNFPITISIIISITMYSYNPGKLARCHKIPDSP
jgi:hypothetical protein